MQIGALIITVIAVVLIAVLEIFWKKSSSKAWTILGICFIIGLAVLGAFIVQSKQNVTTLRVVGYATKPFESDLVKWTLGLKRVCTTRDELPSANNRLSADVQKFKAHIISKGIAEKDILLQPPEEQPMMDNYGNIHSYVVAQNILITSTQIDMIEDMALNSRVFSELDLEYRNSNLGYYYTKLPELKKALLSEATKDAVARAKEITSAAKTRLGKMAYARAGVFQITEPYSTDISDYGVYNVMTRSKHISVTLTAEFRLK